MRALQRIKEQRGFTIVELIIVIVVIAILAALVITTFSNIQKRARDTDRQNDIKSIHSVLEVYYADRGYYPTLADVQNGLPGMDEKALVPPGEGAEQISAAAPSTQRYQYAPEPEGCNNTENNYCTKYTLAALLENGQTFSRTSLADQGEDGVGEDEEE
jgi:prepilin-type N-terminal cleavage/methylation domain-containing protein